MGRKCGELGGRSFAKPEPSLFPGTSGSPGPQSHPADSRWTWLGEGSGPAAGQRCGILSPCRE